MEYCICKSPPGYLSLRDEHNTFVCGACLKPAYLVWLGSERFCEECGCSIYTLWELICSLCRTAILESLGEPPHDPDMVAAFGVQPDWWQPWLSWPEAAERSKSTWPWRWVA